MYVHLAFESILRAHMWKYIFQSNGLYNATLRVDFNYVTA